MFRLILTDSSTATVTFVAEGDQRSIRDPFGMRVSGIRTGRPACARAAVEYPVTRVEHIAGRMRR